MNKWKDTKRSAIKFEAGLFYCLFSDQGIRMALPIRKPQAGRVFTIAVGNMKGIRIVEGLSPWLQYFDVHLRLSLSYIE